MVKAKKQHQDGKAQHAGKQPSSLKTAKIVIGKDTKKGESTVGKPAVRPKGSGGEIDDIFNTAVKAKKQKEPQPKKEAPKKVAGNKDDIFGELGGKARKKTEEGFNIYTEDELGLTKASAGMTDLCPFDCDCCF